MSHIEHVPCSPTDQFNKDRTEAIRDPLNVGYIYRDPD